MGLKIAKTLNAYRINALHCKKEPNKQIKKIKMKFFDLQKLCSIYKIVLNIELILGVIASLLTLADTHGLSLVYFGLFIFLTLLPQYIFLEISLLIDKLDKNQKQSED